VTVGELVDRIAEALVAPGVPPARAEARDLIAAVLDQPRFWPSAHRDVVLDVATVGRIEAVVARRREGMPLQYAVGRAPFRHLSLAVDRRVLIPRPETELLVDLVLAAQQGGRGRAVDVGTGSGAIALALAAESAFDEVHAIDRSAEALTVAQTNLAAIPEDRRDRLRWHEGDLLAPVLGQRFDVVVSNPPYISPTEASTLPALVRDWEPHLALFAADDGMALIRALVPQAAEVLVPGGLLAMEIDARRATLAREVVEGDPRFAAVELRMDLTGRPRFVVARRQER